MKTKQRASRFVDSGKWSGWTLGCAALIAGASASAVDLAVTYSTSVSSRPVAWSQPVSIPKFNPAIGTLNSVVINVSGVLRSTPRVENLDPVPRTLVTGSSGQVTVFNADYTTALVGVSPSVTTSYPVSAYDGVTDYAGSGGTSGSGFVVDPPLSAAAYATVQFQPGSTQFPGFLGTDNTTLGLVGEGYAIATGAQNISFQISTEVGATVDVTYNYTPVDSSIAGTVWVDANQDGQPQANEIGLPGVTVTLLDLYGVPVPGVPSRVTDSRGNYLFTGVSIPAYPGYAIFTVAISQPAGYTQIFDFDDGLTTAPTTPNSATFYMESQQFQQDVNFGFYQPVGSIGDRVWADTNGDGVQDVDELGLPNVTVTLYATGNLNTPLATQMTDHDGKYLFTNLQGGDYTVVVSSVPARMRQSYDLDDGTPANGIFATANRASLSIVTGEKREDVDFGYQSIDATVGNLVWLDRNGNGQLDSDETALPGVAVTLRDANNVLLASTATDANGHYQFTGLPAGTYTVRVTPPPGYQETYDLDDPNSPPGGFISADSATFTLTTGQVRNDVNFGYAGGTLGDRVWDDSNANGIQDGGESGLVGAVITITRAATANLPAATYETTTDQNGFYTVGDLDLPAGTYTVAVTPPPGYRQTFDLDDGARLSGFTTPLAAVVVLAAGQVRTDVDFGFQKLGSVGDRVWLDYNGNGVQDAGETGISGRTVALSKIVNGVESALGTQITDANGFYSYTNLPPGNYRLTVINPPTKHIPTWDYDNQSGAVTTPHTAVFTLTEGQQLYTADFGYQPLGSIGDTVWLDVNRNGVQDGASEVGISGALITATSSTSGTYTTTTDANGHYLLDNLPAANYTVVVQLPTGLSLDPTYDLDDGFRLSGFSTPNQASSLLAPGENNMAFDFGYAARQAVLNSTIGNFVWNDTNSNGVQDTGEPGLPNVPIQLLQNGTLIATTTTAANGQYLFTGLAAGTYTVVITLPPGTPTFDLDDGKGPFVTPNRATVTVAENQTRLDVDFGYFQQPSLPLLASVGDFVWFDANGNGLQDANESGFSGVLVELLSGAAGTTVIAATNTDSAGKYAFRNVTAGTYRVRVTPPANYTFTTRDVNSNANDTTDSDIETTSGVTLAFSVLTGQQLLTIDAGLVPVYQDLCVDEATHTVGMPICDQIQTVSYWTCWKTRYTTTQFQSIIANTPHYKAKTCAQVDAILKNTANTYNRDLMVAELTASTTPSFAAGTYCTGSLNGKSVSQILTLAYNTPAASASAELRDAIGYLCDDNNSCSYGGTWSAGACSPTGCTQTSYTPCYTVSTSSGSGSCTSGGSTTTTSTTCRIVSSTVTVADGTAFVISGVGSDFIFDTAVGRFLEQSGGRAILTGFVRSRATPTDGFQVSLCFSNYTATVPALPVGSPRKDLSLTNYVENGGTISTAGWTYYKTCTGTLTGFGSYQGTVLALTTTGPSFQTGFGANGKNTKWGACGGFNFTRTSAAGSCSRSVVTSGTGTMSFNFNNCATDGTTGSIGNRVWVDTNANGVQEATEVGLPNVVVALRTAAGVLLGQTTTDATGVYLFTGLPAGGYRVTVSPPTNYQATFDLDGTATLNTTAVTLTTGQSRTDVDFGYRIPTSGTGGVGCKP